MSSVACFQRPSRRLRACTAGILLVILPVGLAAYDALYAFGDSLTDTGREPAEPVLHYHGRWSNGPLWVEYLSERLGFAYNPSNNFAHSGAQCDDTLGQIHDFSPTNEVSQSLFVVWAGGNDFLQEYDAHWFNDAGWDAQIAYSVGNLSNAVVTLCQKGAGAVLVPNTVDVTEIPAIKYLPSILRGYLRGKVLQFNHELDLALDRIQAAVPQLRLYRVDVFAKVNGILGNARQYGFTETKIDALADVTLLDKRFDGPGSRYVFWDPIHPTTKAHGIIADWFHAAVAPRQPRWSIALRGTNVVMTLTSLHVDQVYAIECSTNLQKWAEAARLTVYDDQGVQFASPNRPLGEFFRAWLLP